MNFQRRAYSYQVSNLAKKSALILITSISLSFGAAVPPLKSSLSTNLDDMLMPISHRIVARGKPFTINCVSHENISFTCPINFNPEIKNESHSCGNGRFFVSIRKFDGIFNASLTVQHASYLNTGSYGCLTKTSNAKQYIFVEDPYLLLLPMKHVYRIDGVESVIPCKPTHPDVRIQLLQRIFLKNTSDLHTMKIVYSPNEKQDAKDKIDRIWTHDPLEGFRLLDPAQMPNVEGIYECRAEKRSFDGTVNQMGVRFEIIRCPDERPPATESETDDFQFSTSLILSSTIASLGIITLLSLAIVMIKVKVESREKETDADPRWEFPRCRLKLQSQLDVGCFGRILKAEARGIVPNEPVTTVAVKTVHSNYDFKAKHGLLEEFKILSQLGRHLNIVHLLGACTKYTNKDPLLIVFEYCPFSNLRAHLITFRHRFSSELNESGNLMPRDHFHGQNNTGNSTFNTRDLIYWAYQISRAMAYLVVKKVLHRDLALRNILLTANNIVKVSDFGMSLQTHSGTESRNNEELLPIKWMAIEALKDGLFSHQSDVWSFGVVLWELFTLGETPYTVYAKANKDFLVRILLMGRRLKKPTNVPEFVSAIMYSCWRSEPLQRPNFHELEKMFYAQLDPHVVLELMKLDENYIKMSKERDMETDTAPCCINVAKHDSNCFD